MSRIAKREFPKFLVEVGFLNDVLFALKGKRAGLEFEPAMLQPAYLAEWFQHRKIVLAHEDPRDLRMWLDARKSGASQFAAQVAIIDKLIAALINGEAVDGGLIDEVSRIRTELQGIMEDDPIKY